MVAVFEAIYRWRNVKWQIKKRISRGIFLLSITAIYIFVFLLNYFTTYIADDYTYMYSFADNTKIANIADIFHSIFAHAIVMNGRLVAHFFVQLSLLFPLYIFDFVNSAFFIILLISLMYYYENRNYDFVVVWIVFAAICYCTPSFGQVFYGKTVLVIICGE